MAADLLPPSSTDLERAFAKVTTRLSDIPVDYSSLWDPMRCPRALLPWLAWSLSIDRWDTDWGESEQRDAVAGAIAAQRIKGTRAAVESVLADFDQLLELVEWFEATPQLDPYTFEIRLPAVDADGLIGGTRMSADTARAIVRAVALAKPVRAHFELVAQLGLIGTPAPLIATQATGYRRLDLDGTQVDDSQPWTDLVQDQNGEPLSDDNGNFIDGSAA